MGFVMLGSPGPFQGSVASMQHTSSSVFEALSASRLSRLWDSHCKRVGVSVPQLMAAPFSNLGTWSSTRISVNGNARPSAKNSSKRSHSEPSMSTCKQYFGCESAEPSLA